MAAGDQTPTKVESEHKLLDACLDVLEDRADSEKLREALSVARKDLGEMEKDFENTVNEQPQNIQQESQKEIEYAHESFNAYYQALDIIESYFKTRDKFDIVRGAEHVRGATVCLNTAFINFRNRALIAMGPTDIPVLNLVLRIYSDLRDASPEQAQEHSDRLIVTIFREFTNVQRAMPELNRENLMPEEELLKKAYEEHQAACLAIRELLRDKNMEGLEQAIHNYRQAAESLKNYIPAVNLRRMTQIPTTSPQANLVINLGRTLLNNSGSEEMFLEALKNLEENFNNVKMQFEAIKRNPTDSVLVNEEIPNAEKAIAAFESGITDYYRFIEVRDTLLLQQAASRLEEGVKQIQRCGDLFQSIAEREGKTPCIRCSHYNPPDRKTCEHCGAVLPVSAESEAARTFEIEEEGEGAVERKEEEIIMTENIYKIFDAVNKVSEGEISIDEFKEIVDWMEQVVIEGRKAYAPLPAVNFDSMKDEIREQAAQVRDMLEEAKEVFREGADDLLTGLSFFRQYIQQGDKNNLVTGVQIIWQGVGKLQKVQKATEILKKAQEEAKQK